MSFLEATRRQVQERFSLLVLEPGEIYFQDFSVVYFPFSAEWGEEETIKRQQKGWLKVCSKSVVFDPKDPKYPLLKIPYRDIETEPCKWTASIFPRLLSKQDVIEVTAEQFAEIKENNVIAPYVFKRIKTHLLFGLNFRTTDECLPLMCQLHRASSLDIGDQTAMINAIVLARQNRVEFDKSRLEDLQETIVGEFQGDQITPLVTNPGRILLTSKRLYFQPFNNICPVPVLKIKLSEIARVIKRRFLLKQIGLEIYCKSASTIVHLYLSLRQSAFRDQLYDQITAQSCLQLDDLNQENMTMRWQNGLVSNYDYLIYLNSLADRSINDLTQYPVFPWVLSDYTSRHLAPEYVLCLQNGRFDQPDRMFNSIEDTWQNCLNSMSDFKELIPEFYNSEGGDFLINRDLINFGMRQNGTIIGDVQLPPWASDSKDFIKKMRRALESDHVSQNLHQWIDLIFGYKQRDEEAENSYNVFYHLTYEGYIDIESIEDLNERAALETQIMEFGQTPKQIFTKPHPQRHVGAPVVPLELGVAPLRLTEAGDRSASATRASCLACGTDSTSTKTNHVGKFWSKVGDVNLYSSHSHNLHKNSVTDVRWNQKGSNVLSVAKDGMLKVFCMEERRQLRSISISTMPLSSCILLPDQSTAIIASWDNHIYYYSLEFGKVLQTVYAHDDAVSSLWHCHKNCGILLSSSWDSTVKLWKCNSSDIIDELEHDVGVTRVCATADASRVATGTKEGEIYVWDTQTRRLLLRQQGHIGAVNSASFSPDERHLLSCGEDGCLRVMDVATGTEIFTKTCDKEPLCHQWDGRSVLTGHRTGDLTAWDLLQAKVRRSFRGHEGAVNSLAISSQGLLASGGEDNHVRVWNSES